MDKQKLYELRPIPELPAPAGEITVCWGTPQQTFADGYSAAQMDANERAAWTAGLDYGMAHAPAADETTLPDLARLLGTASKEGKAVKLSPIAAGTLYNAMTTPPVTEAGSLALDMICEYELLSNLPAPQLGATAQHAADMDLARRIGMLLATKTTISPVTAGKLAVDIVQMLPELGEAQVAELAALRKDCERNKGLFLAACSDLGLVSEELGLHPDDGGAAPIIDAIKDLRAGVPAGWKVVPIEPTEDMVIDGFESAPDRMFDGEDYRKEYDAMSGCQQAAFRAKRCWAAMLEAAPDARDSGSAT